MSTLILRPTVKIANLASKPSGWGQGTDAITGVRTLRALAIKDPQSFVGGPPWMETFISTNYRSTGSHSAGPESDSRRNHPSADDAMHWFMGWKAQDIGRYLMVREAIASTALSGNRLCEILNSTLTRLEKKHPVSDRYLLGLCWYLRDNHSE